MSESADWVKLFTGDLCEAAQKMLMAIESSIESKTAERQNYPVVVVADNCQDNLTFISFILDALKFKYYLASDGKTALDLVNDKQPDLVLLDIIMPEMNGIEVNVLIKRNQITRHIPTVAITGLTEQEHISAIQNAGFDDYIIKPFMIEDLENRLTRFLKK